MSFHQDSMKGYLEDRKKRMADEEAAASEKGAQIIRRGDGSVTIHAPAAVAGSGQATDG